MSDHIADLFALQHWRARASELERERDEARALAEQFQHELDTVNRLANLDQQQLIEARALLRKCRQWVARGLDDHPAPTDDDRGLLARLDAALGGRDE